MYLFLCLSVYIHIYILCRYIHMFLRGWPGRLEGLGLGLGAQALKANCLSECVHIYIYV